MASSDPASTAPDERSTDRSLETPPDERMTASMSPDDGGPPEPALTSVREGDVLSGKYRVEGVIGGGGMGVVFEATHLQLETKVAVKVLRPDAERRGVAVARLLREARASARIQGEHVVRVTDVGTLETGAPYIVMELLTGADLGVELRGRGLLAVDDAVEYVLHACEAVAQAHAAGIVHRDLKPSNLFLTRRADGSPCVKVLDFGIAKAQGGDEAGDDPSLTSSRAVLGSPMYMSPEQIRSAKTVDARTDVWSLGVILFELLTGERPFTGSSASSRLAAIAADAPVPLLRVRPDAPAGLEAVILRCLEKDVDRRTPSVAVLARALAPFAPSRAMGSIERAEASLRAPLAPIEAAPVASAPARRPRAGRRALGAGLAALVAVAAAVYGVRALRAPAGADRAASTSNDPSKPRRAVAVLGFKNLSGKPDSAWLSTALSEMFGTELAIGERLRVIPSENVARVSMELGAADAEGLAGAAQAQKSLGADVLVHGSYLVLGDGSAKKVRLDVRVDGASPASISETGTEAELFDLVARVGARLRDALGVGALSGREEDSVRAARPASAEAARLYAEGLAKLRLRDALGAQASLSAATAADPGYPLAHAALSEAWSTLGRDVDARAEAKRAFDLSAGLSREERMLVEGRYRVATRQWDEAISTYRGLFGFFPDNLEYGLLLAGAERRSGKGKDALATVDALHRLPAPAGQDPRIDIEESAVAELQGDTQREQDAAGRALARAEALGAGNLAARARLPLAWSYMRLGDPKRAQETYEQARQAFAAEGDRGMEASALTNLAIVHAEQGQSDEARELFEAALGIQRALGNRTQVARVLGDIANLVEDGGKAAEARALYEQALAILREEGDVDAAARTLSNIAFTYGREGDFAASLRTYQEQLALSRKLGAEDAIAVATNSVAATLYAQGDLAGAKVTFEEALQLCRKLEDKGCTANSLAGLGALLVEKGEVADAGLRFEEALELCRQTGAKGPAAVIRADIAGLALDRGDAVEAEGVAREAEAALHETGQVEEASAAALVITALLAGGKRTAAEAEAARAAPLLAAAETADARIPLALALARVKVASRKPASMAEGVKDAEAALADAGKASARTALEARCTLGELELAVGRPAGAARLRELERDAAKMGFARIAHRAAARR
jgi:tetratricopeptide (TPR) repeat protein/TolB-like protein